MTKQQLAERYKEIEIKQITDDILEVNLWKGQYLDFEIAAIKEDSSEPGIKGA